MYTGVHPAPSQRDRVYTQIKTRLLDGDFGIGSRLGEVTLARELGASRTPVRESLLRLWSEGLVERHPEGGFQPVLPDASVIHELYGVRVALERYALTDPLHAGGRHDLDLLTEVQSEWRALATDDHVADPEFVLLDESFHVGIAEASGNGALVEMLQGVNERIRIVRTQDFLTVERIVTTIEEHLGIVDALIEGRSDLALQRFGAHLDASLAVVDERSTQACLRMLRSGRNPR